MDNNLPTLTELEAFDGNKEEAPVPKEDSLPKRCPHKQVTLVSSQEVRCSCGAGWTGYGVSALFKSLTSE